MTDSPPRAASLTDLLGLAEVSRQVLESVPGGVVVVSGAGAILYANDEAQRLLGLSYEELSQRYVNDWNPATIYEDGRPCPVEDYPVSRCLVSGRRQGPVTIGVQRATGDTSWCVFNAVPLQAPGSSEQLGAVVTFLDVTSRREVEQALRSSEARYRSLVKHSQDTVMIVDRDERILFINRVAVGFSLEGVIGANVRAFSTDPGSMEDAIRAVFDRGETWQIETEASNGRIYAGYWLPLERDPSGVVQTAMVVTSDVTGLRREEADRRRLEADLSRRVGELNVLAGGIAHDFNNLLQGILGGVELALRQLPESHSARGPLEDVRADARHAGDLTRQLLAYSGAGQLCVEPLDLEELLMGMWRLVRANVSRRAKVRLDLGGGLPSVEADATQLRQVVMNLVTNASEALEGKEGAIEIVTSVVPCEVARMRAVVPVSEPYAERYLSLEVRDEGCGMDERTRIRLFDPFFSTKSRTGRGLGLAAVHGIVRAHRGGVAVTSAPGAGTSIQVLLPALAHEPPLPARTVGDPQPPGPAPSSAGRVLIVEDEPHARRVAQLALESVGYEVVAVGTARAALALFEGEQASFSVALVDQVLPDGDGAELLAAFHRLAPRFPVVLCSGYHEQAISVEVRDALAGFLPKPYPLEDLLRLINAAIR